MPENTITEKLRTNLQDRGIAVTSDPSSGIYLFFSFDLVNSTQFKLVNASTWPMVVMRFYELAITQLSTRFAHAEVWNLVGDEVLFFRRVRSRKDLFSALNAAHSATAAATDILHSQFPHARDLLAVKSTVWIAKAESVKPGGMEEFTQRVADSVDIAKNIVVDGAITSRQAHVDFLGPEIDVGFRISKFALRRRLVVSADLAWLLYRYRADQSKIESQLKIVSFETMKGVWGGRHYPIIWFENDWNGIENTFLYDERETSPLAKKALDHAESANAEIKTIEKIYDDLGRSEPMTRLAEEIDGLKLTSAPQSVRREISFATSAEVHCVAVCLTRDGRILAARRPSSKRRHANKLEFGCGQLRWGDSFEKCLQRAYSDDFGAKLVFPKPIVPLSTFELEDNDEHRQIPGLIFFAEIENPDEIESKFSRQKHSELIWISPGQTAIDASECVPDFVSVCEKARSAWAAWKSARS